MRVAVVGGGWAGLAAAVRACELGAQVHLYEMAARPGGRARSLDGGEPSLDNGQHILIGAYADTLALMRRVGADPERLLLRLPLRLSYPDGDRLALGRGPTALAFTRAVLTAPRWPWAARLSLLRRLLRWRVRGFHAADDMTVAGLCEGLHALPWREFVAPLCVAALNTPPERASAAVFLRVLRDALFSGPGGADLLLPRQGLGALLPEPALRWLHAQGAVVQRGHRVQGLRPAGVPGGWLLDEDPRPFDAVLLCCSSQEAARLTQPQAPAWSAQATGLSFEPIVTVYLTHPGARLPAPMLALHEGPDAPAQFAFDLGQLGLAPGHFSLVISGAAPWLKRGLQATSRLALHQARQALGWGDGGQIHQVIAEKRATFSCTPGLRRPPARVAPGLWAAGDYVQGPYPATLEGAVKAGLAAAEAALGQSTVAPTFRS
ncbi:hydroxysqualene dehydroxylase HpnE [Pelomonas sp. CA6]|nr:hydroxysqualene dehydroxylase HpnE [Pelomonas sp. CA6]